MKKGQELAQMGVDLNMNIDLTTKQSKRSHKSSERDAGASRRKHFNDIRVSPCPPRDHTRKISSPGYRQGFVFHRKKMFVLPPFGFHFYSLNT